jgi:hypothetical protein
MRYSQVAINTSFLAHAAPRGTRPASFSLGSQPLPVVWQYSAHRYPP